MKSICFHITLLYILISYFQCISLNKNKIPNEGTKNQHDYLVFPDGKRLYPINNEEPPTTDISAQTYINTTNIPLIEKVKNSFSYKETAFYVKYSINTPPFPNWITQKDLEVHLHRDMIVIKAIGSCNSTHRIINENYKKEKNGINLEMQFHYNSNNYMRKINYGRDWETWINLKNPIKKETIPLIEIKPTGNDNAYMIEISIPKSGIDFDKAFIVDNFISLY